MWCCSAYEYAVGEVKMTKIFAVYLQASGFQASRRNMLLSFAVNFLSNMVSPCHTPLMMLILLLSLCRWIAIELFGVNSLQEFDVHIFYPPFM